MACSLPEGVSMLRLHCGERMMLLVDRRQLRVLLGTLHQTGCFMSVVGCDSAMLRRLFCSLEKGDQLLPCRNKRLLVLRHGVNRDQGQRDYNGKYCNRRMNALYVFHKSSSREIFLMNKFECLAR